MCKCNPYAEPGPVERDPSCPVHGKMPLSDAVRVIEEALISLTDLRLDQMQNALAALSRLKEELADYEHTFDLRSKADMRAIKRWRTAHPGKELVQPDHADLVVWLLEQLDAKGTT